MRESIIHPRGGRGGPGGPGGPGSWGQQQHRGRGPRRAEVSEIWFPGPQTINRGPRVPSAPQRGGGRALNWIKCYCFQGGSITLRKCSILLRSIDKVGLYALVAWNSSAQGILVQVTCGIHFVARGPGGVWWAATRDGLCDRPWLWGYILFAYI